MGPILRYYEGQAPDDRGRYLSEIQEWPDDRLEAVHDFIQWMFPLAERSGANPEAPILDDDTIRQFRSRAELRNRLRVSFLRMLRFYGLRYDSASGVERAENFPERSKNWTSVGNHNHLRITRILTSLGILGLAREAAAFFDRLAEIHHDHAGISDETFRYWQSAAQASQERKTAG
jgi:hypothetical protein